MNEAMDLSGESSRDILENISDLIQSIAPDGTILYVNRAWRDAFGWTSEEIASLSLADMIHPDSRQHCMEMFTRVMRGEDVGRVEATFLTKEGKTIILEGTSSCRFENGTPVATRSIFRDITDRKQIQDALLESERRYRRLVDHSMGLICTHDLTGCLLSVNPAGAQALGYDPSEIIGRNLRDFMPRETRPDFADYLAGIQQTGDSSGLLQVVTRQGDTRTWSFHNTLCNDVGHSLYVLGHAQDVTELKRAETAMHTIASTDELTGLYNRRGFVNLARRHREATQSTGTTRKNLLLVYADLDGLKQINDMFGHREGDAAIREAAAILRDTFRAADVIARLGGDEFAVLIIDPAANAGDIVIGRLGRKIDRRAAGQSRPYRISLSVGSIGIAHDDQRSIDELLGDADRAMYAHKLSKGAIARA